MIGAPRSSCTTRLRVTNPALRCQSLKGELGAEPESCTQHLTLTKGLPRYLGLIGVIGLPSWS
jgi:hypothetical protein